MQADFPLTRLERRLLALAIALYLIHLGYAIGAARSFYADGVYFFTKILERQDFFVWGGVSRLFGQIAAQWPIVLALKSGVTNVITLRWLHGWGLFGWYPISLLLCYWTVRHQPRYMVFPLLGLFAGAINAEFDIITDSHRFICFFWPLLLLILFRPGVLASMLIWLCALPLLFTYESMLFFGPLLTAVAFWRSRQTGLQRRSRWFWYILMGWFLAGTLVGLHATLFPAIASNRTNFLISLLFFCKPPDVHYPGILSIVGLVLLARLWSGKLPAWEQRLPVRFLWIGSGACVLVALLPLLLPQTMGLYLQHEARVLNLLLPLALALMLCAVRSQWLAMPVMVWRRAFLLVAVLGTVQSIWQIGATYQWTRYLQIFRQELRHSAGIVPFEQSTLSRLDSLTLRSSRTMNWYWTMPLMSILLAPDGQVNAIVENPVKFQADWQPFDPKIPDQLPDLRRYGISYNIVQVNSPPTPSLQRREGESVP